MRREGGSEALTLAPLPEGEGNNKGPSPPGEKVGGGDLSEDKEG